MPPALYPQAIQIGLLLAGCGGQIALVCGTPGTGIDRDFGPAAQLAFRLEIPFRPKLSGFALRTRCKETQSLLKILDLTSMLVDRDATALRCVESADWTVALLKGLEQVSVRPRQATDF